MIIFSCPVCPNASGKIDKGSCYECGGSRTDPHGGECDRCEGSGREETRCWKCHGYGEIEEECGECGGTGRQDSSSGTGYAFA